MAKMNVGEAMDALKRGERVKREDWPHGFWLVMVTTWIGIKRLGCSIERWEPDQENVLATDWAILA